MYDNVELKSHIEKLYNMDEEGCRLTIHHQQAVSVKKGPKRANLWKHAERVTIAGCAIAELRHLRSA